MEVLDEQNFQMDADEGHELGAIYPDNTVLVDLDELGAHLDSSDGIPQREVTEAVYRSATELRGERDNYESRDGKGVTLKELKVMFEHKLVEGAMQLLLKKKTKIEIDNENQLLKSDPLTIWNSNADRRLDYLCCVGGRCGFDAAISNTESDVLYTFVLDIKPHLSFYGKYAQLGGDQKGSLLRVGSYQAREDVYIYMCPSDILNSPDAEITKPGFSTGPTVMEQKHIRILMAFIAYCLSEMRASTGISCARPYDIPLPPRQIKWEQFTNLYGKTGRCSSSLNHADMVEFNKKFNEEWVNWIRESPWSDDEFLSNRTPVGVTIRYGQNVHMSSNTNTQAFRREQAQWEAERRWSNLRFISFALATHINCKRATRVDEVPVETVLAELGQARAVYTHFEPEKASEIRIEQLKDYPVFDENGMERKVYTEQGTLIRRVRPMIRRDEPTGGILVHLNTVEQMFNPEVEEEDVYMEEEDMDMEEREEKVTVSVYPQSFFSDLGHIKANGVAHAFKEVVEEVDRESKWDEGGNNNNTNVYMIHPGRRALTPISCQFYNQLSHRLAKKAGTQEVQRGDQTAAMARSYPDYNSSAKTRGKRLQELCESRLPFQRHFELLGQAETEVDRPTDLRVENVFALDMHAIPIGKRNGAYMYENILQSLLKGWQRPAVWESLRPHLIALSPDVFPQCYQWATYGICSILKKIFDQDSQRERTGPSYRSDPFLVEFCSVLERTLVYATTGNGKVLHRATMDPLLLSTGLLRTGFPALDGKLWTRQRQGANREMNFAFWPTLNETGNGRLEPAVSTSNGLRFHLNKTAALIHFASLRIQFVKSMSLQAEGEFSHITRLNTLIALHIMRIVLEHYVDDIVDAVKIGVMQELSRSQDTVEKEYRAKNTHCFAKKVKLGSFTFNNTGSGSTVLEHLLSAIRGNDTEEILKGFPPGKAACYKTTYLDVAAAMLKNAKEGNTEAPFFKGGKAQIVLKVAITFMREKSNQSSSFPRDLYGYLTQMLAQTLQVYKFAIIPWKPDLNMQRSADWKHWATIIGRGEYSMEKHSESVGEMTTQRALESAMASMQADDPTSTWKIDKLLVRELESVLNKRKLPQMIVPFNSSAKAIKPGEEYVMETYLWVWENFNPQKASHRVALVISMLLAKLSPHNGYDREKTEKEFGSGSSKKMDASEWRCALENIQWEENKSLKSVRGDGDKLNSIMCGFVALAIGLLEESSPLHLQMGIRKGLGSGWNKRHTTKGISILNLYRADFLKGKGLMPTGTFSTNYWTKSEMEYMEMLEVMQRSVKSDSPFKYYDLANSLLNEDAAHKLGAMELGALRPRKRKNNNSNFGLEGSASPQKRARINENEIDSEDD